MLSPSAFKAQLTKHKILILDGGLATHLETQGHDLNHPLWSGVILQSKPWAIQSLHKEYYLSGSNIATTASYQTSVAGLKEHFNLSQREAESLIRSSVHLAQKARDEVLDAGVEAVNPSEKTPSSSPLLVAGSVGPYGAYLANGAEYTGSYGEAATADLLREFHCGRMRALVDAGADLLAFETIPRFDEILVLLELLSSSSRGFDRVSGWISCTLRGDSAGDDVGGFISDGTEVAEVLRTICAFNARQRARGDGFGEIVAFGLNCVSPRAGLHSIRRLREIQKRDETLRLPLVYYPNSGEKWDGVEKTWSEDDDGVGGGDDDGGGGMDVRVERFVRECVDNGVRLIGGCCRTDPSFIKAVVDVVRDKSYEVSLSST